MEAQSVTFRLLPDEAISSSGPPAPQWSLNAAPNHTLHTQPESEETGSWREWRRRGLLKPEAIQFAKLGLALSVGNVCEYAPCLALSVGNVCEYAPMLWNLMVVGQLPDSQDYQAAVAIARTFYNVTQYSVAWSLTGGLFTLVPEAVGAGQLDLLPVLAQRALWLSLLCTLPMNALVAFVQPLLVALGQTQRVAELAAPYVEVLMVHYVLTIVFTVLQRLLQSLDLSVALSVVICLSSVASMASCWLFVHVCHWGYLGAAYSQALLALLQLLGALFLLLYAGHGSLLWPRPLRAILAWREVKRYMSLAFPLLLDAMVTWWSFELVLVLVSIVPTASEGANRTAGIAAVSIFMEVEMLFFFIYLATGVAANIRVGLHIGAGSRQAASAAIWITLFLTIAVALFINSAACLVCLRCPHLFSNDEEVQALVVQLAWILTLTLSVGAVRNHLSSVQTALGQQKRAFYINLVASYVISLPLAIVLTFPAKWRVSADYVWSVQLLLLSLPLAELLSAVAQGWLVWHIDWPEKLDKESTSGPRCHTWAVTILIADRQSSATVAQRVQLLCSSFVDFSVLRLPALASQLSRFRQYY
eukprot:g52065.t1